MTAAISLPTSPAFISELPCQVQAALSLIPSNLSAKLAAFDAIMKQVLKALVSSVRVLLHVEATKRTQGKTAEVKGIMTLPVTVKD